MTIEKALLILVRLDRDPERAASYRELHLQALDMVEAKFNEIVTGRSFVKHDEAEH